MDKESAFEYIAFVLILLALVGLNEMSVSLLGSYGVLIPIACVVIPVIRHKLNKGRFL
jgi:nitrate reductase NapE component